MGLFDHIFKKPNPSGRDEGFFKTLTAYSPAFTNFGGSIYESALVRAAINARATHISKLNVELTGTAKPYLQRALKAGPNEFQTWSQFLYRLSSILDVQNTAFIVPVINNFGEVSGVFPVLPDRCEMVQISGELYLRYQFTTGDTAAVAFNDCAVMTKFQYSDDLKGNDNRALLPTMQLISMQNQGIEEGVKSAATYRFMAQMSNFAKPEDIAKERKRFSSENLSGEVDAGGLLLFPNTYTNVQQIKSAPFVVDAEQMKIIQSNVFNYFGVNEDVLQNKAYGDAWSAFYEGAIESFAVQFSDVMTKMLFSQRERTQGSSLIATANRLQYMTNKDKLDVSAQMADRGLMTRNEIREIWNLPPLPEGIGDQLPVRGEYYNLNSEGEKNDASDGES